MCKRSVIVVGSLLLGSAALAETPADILAGYAAATGQERSELPGFSPIRGEHLFNRPQGREWSCSSCHTEDPGTSGRHATTGKPIAPMAPGVNPERFTSANKVEKWFKRNCNDVLGRSCSAQEKGDVLAYLMSVR